MNIVKIKKKPQLNKKLTFLFVAIWRTTLIIIIIKNGNEN